VADADVAHGARNRGRGAADDNDGAVGSVGETQDRLASDPAEFDAVAVDDDGFADREEIGSEHDDASPLGQLADRGVDRQPIALVEVDGGSLGGGCGREGLLSGAGRGNSDEREGKNRRSESGPEEGFHQEEIFPLGYGGKRKTCSEWPVWQVFLGPT
jgi:hypothetical protein